MTHLKPGPGGPILIVEDEKNLGVTLSEYLRSIGHACFLATNGKDAYQVFKKEKPHVVLMDIGLPDTNGLILAKKLRQEREDFVLLFLSAQNDPDIKVEGLEIGARDYITKPFALKEIVIRLKRILETQENISNELSSSQTIQLGTMTLFVDRFEIESSNGQSTTLSQKECKILELLYKNQNKAVTRETMIEKIWGSNHFPSNRTVDNYIVKLRKLFDSNNAFASNSNKNVEIKSIRGIGSVSYTHLTLPTIYSV